LYPMHVGWVSTARSVLRVSVASRQAAVNLRGIHDRPCSALEDAARYHDRVSFITRETTQLVPAIEPKLRSRKCACVKINTDAGISKKRLCRVIIELPDKLL
jgi:hypothetical protein